MKEMCARLSTLYGLKIIFFPEDLILNASVDTWPRCHALISFFSNGFPLHKAEEYAAKFQPFLVNDLRPQHLLKDRRHVYRLLSRHNIPVPQHVVFNRSTFSPANPASQLTPDSPEADESENELGDRMFRTSSQASVVTDIPDFEVNSEEELQEFDDYIIVRGTRIDKPFVEKPVNADDHNIYIYYPRSEGGGSVR